MKAKAKRRKRKIITAERVVLTSIALCFVIVVFIVVFSLVNTPESRVTNLVSKLSAEYYEEYFYPEFSESESFKSDPEKMMEVYGKYGFSPITLRQLLLYNNQQNAKYADELKTYCNEDQTSIRYYPEKPYGKTNYRSQITYSCGF